MEAQEPGASATEEGSSHKLRRFVGWPTYYGRGSRERYIAYLRGKNAPLCALEAFDLARSTWIEKIKRERRLADCGS